MKPKPKFGWTSDALEHNNIGRWNGESPKITLKYEGTVRDLVIAMPRSLALLAQRKADPDRVPTEHYLWH